VPSRVRRHLPGVFIAAVLVSVPTIGRAQESSLPTDAVIALLNAAPAASLSDATGFAVADQRLEPTVAPAEASRTTEAGTSGRGVLLPLYISFAGLQALDVHSTLRALDAGGTEGNPLMRGIADHPAALVAMKAGVTASTILLTEKLRVKNRVGAIVMMAALNSAYAMVVVHNYRAIP